MTARGSIVERWQIPVQEMKLLCYAKIFIERSDGKSLIIKRYWDFLLAFGAIYCVTNLSPNI
jgi:hypothetical protein